MKSPFTANTASVLTCACFILLIALYGTGCAKITLQHIINYGEVVAPSALPAAPDSQLVVWIKPGSTTQQVDDWIDSVYNHNGKINKPQLCSECDNQLMLLTGPGITSYIQQALASGGPSGNKGGGPSGGDGPIYYSVNYSVDLNDSLPPIIKGPYNNAPPTNSNDLKDITVAVFDTGIDPNYINSQYFYSNDTSTSCFGNTANNGWNFTDAPPDANWFDDFPEKHGTVVSKFVVDEVQSLNGNGIKILPVKIHNYKGQSTLFSVLCGFSYAVNRGAQIINASFGYYTPRPVLATSDEDSCAVLLKEYVKTYLTGHNILLVAAAGNYNDIEEPASFAPVTDSGKRNLDSVSFYPASLASDSDLTNIFAVTTVNKISVCRLQNFSANVVDVGVIADDSASYTFQNPLFVSQSALGSSFATPIVIGKICANYHLFINPTTGMQDFSKQNIIRVLTAQGILYSDSLLTSKIKNGIVTQK